MSAFDINEILNTPAGRMATRREPVGEGDWPAQIVDVKGEVITQMDKETGVEVEIPVINVVAEITDEAERERLKMKSNPTVQRRIWLNMVEDSETEIDVDNNTLLGQIREAVGANDEEDWKISDLVGATLVVRVGHTQKKDDPEVVYANMIGFAPLD